MESERNSNPETKTKGKRKWLILFSGIILASLIAVFFLIPYVASSEWVREIILQKINKTGKVRLTLTDHTFSWLDGIELDGLSFKDSTGRLSGNIEYIHTRPHYFSLLLGHLSFGKTIIENPRIFIQLAEKAKKSQSEAEAAVTKKDITVLAPVKHIELEIQNGKVDLTNRKEQTFNIYELDSDIKLDSYGRYIKFNLKSSLKGGNIQSKGDLNFHGKEHFSFKELSANLTLKVDKMLLHTLGPMFTAAGIDLDAKGLVSTNVNVHLKKGRLIKSHGRISGEKLELTGDFFENDILRITDLDINVPNAGTEEGIELGWVKVEGDWLNGKISGHFPMRFQPMEQLLRPGADFRLDGYLECNIAKATSRMPRLLRLKEGTQVESGKLNVNVSTNVIEKRKTVSISARLAELTGSTGGKHISLSEPVTADVNLAGDETGAKFDKTNFSASFGQISGSGSTQSMNYHGRFDLGKLQSEFGQFLNTKGLETSGAISINGKIRNLKDKAQISGSSIIKGLLLKRGNKTIISEPKAQLDFSVTAAPGKDIIGLSTVQFKGDSGKITLDESTIPLSEKSTEKLELKVSAQGVDLHRIQAFSELSGKPVGQMQLYGTANSDITIKRQTAGYRAFSNSEIKDFKLVLPGEKSFQQSRVSIAFDAGINPTEKEISVSNLNLSTPDVNVSGEFSRTTKEDKSRIQGKAECKYEWEAVRSLLRAYFPEGLNVEGQRKDTIEISSTYPVGEPNKIPANFNLTLTTGFAKAEYSGLNFGATNLKLKAENGILNIPYFSTKVNNGNFAFSGTINLQKKPLILRTPGQLHIINNVELNDEIGAKFLRHLNPVFAGATKIRGIADFNSQELKLPLGKASGKETVIKGVISIPQLTLEGSDLIKQIFLAFGKSPPSQQFVLHPTQFTFKDGIVSYDNMQIDAGEYPINFKGRIDPDRKLDMTVILPFTLDGKLVKTAGAAEQRIAVPLKGTIHQPEINLEKLIRDQTIEKGIELLEDLLK